MKKAQNYSNHSRLDLGFHGILAILIIGGMIGSLFNLSNSLETENLYSASLLVLVFLILMLMYAYVRLFPLKVQDRAIRAEENFRHFILTGRPLPPELRLSQIIALRFASDAEFPGLVQNAILNKLSSKEIKIAIKDWRADYHRA